MRTISKVGVLGSGVMGGAIAAHLANCGIPSVMLDIVPFDLADEDKDNKAKRNSIAAAAKKALLKTKPAPLYKKSNADLIEIGNFDDDMNKIADCDWVVEVVTLLPHLPWALVEQRAQHEDFVVDLVLPLAVRCQFGHDQGDPHGSPACAVEWLWVTDDDDCCLFTAG